jgi:hypothetical protein
MGTSSQSDFVLDLGRDSIVCTALGAVWLGLSLAAARAFVPIVVVLFSIISIALYAILLPWPSLSSSSPWASPHRRQIAHCRKHKQPSIAW